VIAKLHVPAQVVVAVAVVETQVVAVEAKVHAAILAILATQTTGAMAAVAVVVLVVVVVASTLPVPRARVPRRVKAAVAPQAMAWAMAHPVDLVASPAHHAHLRVSLIRCVPVSI
jgi:Mg2+/Co2+ transporter CorB